MTTSTKLSAKTVSVSLALTGDTTYAAAVDRLARQERRSRSSLLEFALAELGRARGIELPDRFPSHRQAADPADPADHAGGNGG
jgi:hypothetical protein